MTDTPALRETVARVSAALADAERFESLSAPIRVDDLRALISAIHDQGSGLREVTDFLLGEGKLDGKWVGDEYEGLPRFWWRTHLRRALSSQGGSE